jgi:glycosyltransferase involved in cell wall biosynthesis
MTELHPCAGTTAGGHRVAVAVPCYNDGATLLEALGSLEEQEPCEVVVVDDGSDDARTIELLESLQTRTGVKVVHQQNSGLAVARMTGLRSTSAPYFLPLDADDLLSPGALRTCADALDANPEAVAAWGDVERFGDFVHYVRGQESLDAWRVTYLNGVPGTVMFRRTALLAVGGWQLREGYEDWDVWMSLAERGWDGVYVPHAMLRYRVHGSRLWSTWVPRHEDFYGELRRRHARLFAQRGQNRRSSPAPRHVKILFPLIDRLPVISEYAKHRLYHVATEPRRVLKARLSRHS